MARRTALLRLLIGLTLIIQSLVGPAASPIAAQTTGGPPVTFVPSTVATGGGLSVSTSTFDVGCDSPAYVDLVTASMPNTFVANLGTTTFNCDGSFTHTFTVPNVPPGSNIYRVRVHTNPTGGQTSVSAATLTVTAASGGVLSGTAACIIPPRTVLPFATVTVFTGSVLVATTFADGNGSWSVAGVAPNATYTVRYQAQESPTTCGVAVTTGEGGSAVVGDPNQCPTAPAHADNRTWTDALPIPPSSPAITVTDAICHPNESRWYRVTILPGQRVTAEIDDPSFDLELGLYKDIQVVSDGMTAALNQPGGLTLADLQRFTASIPHDVAAPDATAPDATAPDATAPDATAPDATAPDATAPDATAPDATAPDATAPDATAPDATAPDATAATYSAALSSALVAFSDKPGQAPEFVRRHTWDNTGNFYVRVRGHNGTFDDAHRFNLKVTVVNHNCVSNAGVPLNLTTTHFSGFDVPPVPRTLILTNTSAGRFPTGADTAGMLAALNAFAARPEINGLVLDLRFNGGLAADYAQWDQAPQCAPAANIVANQIHDLINVFHTANPTALRYVVIAGGDRVVPFARIVDEAGMSNETDYSPAVFDASESQAALKTGYFLSQDLYGSATRFSIHDHDFHGFDFPVGRLVENPPEIISMLNAYGAANGVIHPGTALVTGYDFLADSSALEAADLLASGLVLDNTLIQKEGEGPTAPTAWTADDLRQRLFGFTHFGILELNAHFSGNTMLAADQTSRVRSGEVATVNDQRFVNSLIMSMGCHSGYNIVDPDATPGTPPADWAQAFAMQGATLVGGAGYQYGNSPFVKYSEVLLSSVTHELRLFDPGTPPGPVPIGQAILNAKRAYVHGGMNGIDEKSLAELTLYGLPMMGVSLPGGRIPRTPPPTPPATTPGLNSNLSSADLPSTYTLAGHDRVLSVPGDPPTSTTATYFDATYPGQPTGDVQTTPGQPVLPQVLRNISVPNVVARGVVLLSAKYTDLFSSIGGANAFRPLVDVAETEVRAVRPAYGSSVFAPAQIVSLAEFDGQFMVQHPFQFRSSSVSGQSSVFGTGRRYDTLSTRVFYSNRTDASALGGPPIIYNTKLTRSPSNPNVLLVDVSVGALLSEGLEDVFVTYTSESTDGPNSLYGTWSSLSRCDPSSPAPGCLNSTAFNNGIGLIKHFTGSIDTTGTGASPTSIRLFVQAVSGTGLVSLATNNGAYYRFVNETATLGSPKASTALALQPVGGSAYITTYRANLPISARLTSNGTPVPNRSVNFVLGRSSVSGVTNASGVASAILPVLVAPDPAGLPTQVTAGFAEDTGLLGSGDRRDVTINRAATNFTFTTPTIPYGGAANVATLFATGISPLRELGVRITLPDSRQLDTLTDGFGRVLFDTLDFQGVQPGAYAGSTISFAGNDRYLPSSVTIAPVVTGANHSVQFNGVNGFAEAPGTPDLNLTGNWTVETWFKDDDVNGFNHDFRQIVMKGDRNANSEAPYYILVGQVGSPGTELEFAL